MFQFVANSAEIINNIFFCRLAIEKSCNVCDYMLKQECGEFHVESAASHRQ